MSHNSAFSHYPVKASSMIGTNISNPDNENLGEIKELVIDPYSGKVAYVVVAFGGFLGLGEKLFAIPFTEFNFSANTNTNQYILKVSKNRLKEAPGFDPDHWPSFADEQWHRDIHQYYDRSPYWE